MNHIRLSFAFSIVALALTTAGRARGAEAATNGPSATLPLSEVILYSSGVGYFERSGDITGRAQVELRFKTEDVNDLLKSMVVQDANGHVSAVTYGSRDPLTRTLRSFGLDLTENPTLGQILNQARGERVTVSSPTSLTGTVLGVEKRRQPVGENKEIEAEYLNLVTDEGLQSVPLAQVQKVKLLNERLDSELHQALSMLAASHEKDKKTVGITFDGEGKRKVAVSYVTQTPVWKTSYRLVLADKDKPFLQGWAIVENTSDEDWNEVKLSLVSGRPISFVMDLYEPLYATRPVVQPELFRSLHPQVYQDAIEGAAFAPMVTAAPATPPAAGRGGRGGGGGAGGAGAPGFGGANGLSSSLMRQSAVAMAADSAANEPISLQKGVAAMADAGTAGELFQYQIKGTVSIARQKSAMLPIVNQDVDGDKVSIYNQSVQAKYPVNGFRLKNTTGLNLMQGPITVFDGGAYAGDARIEDLAPGQERLISYGLDLKTEVEPLNGPGRSDLSTVTLKRGTLVASRKYIEEKTYNVKNRDAKKKTVLIEHPFRDGWDLVEPKEKPERTRNVYRFALAVDPDKLATLKVVEERKLSESIALANVGSDIIAEYSHGQQVSAKVKEALEKIVAKRDALTQLSEERSRDEGRISEITQEQTRIRENMGQLDRTSDLYKTYVSKFTEQEKELNSLRVKIEERKDAAMKQQRELDDYLLNLDLN